MKPNVLKFQSDIKSQVAQKKEKDDCEWWMHPAYCAYYILKHNIENAEEYINKDIEQSYKALPDYWRKEAFKKSVNKYLEQYGTPVCTD